MWVDEVGHPRRALSHPHRDGRRTVRRLLRYSHRPVPSQLVGAEQHGRRMASGFLRRLRDHVPCELRVLLAMFGGSRTMGIAFQTTHSRTKRTNDRGAANGYLIFFVTIVFNESGDIVIRLSEISVIKVRLFSTYNNLLKVTNSMD